MDVVVNVAKSNQGSINLGKIVGIGVERAECDRIINVKDTRMGMRKRLAKQYIFIAISTDNFIERMGKHYAAMNKEVGCAERLKGVKISHGYGMTADIAALIAITQIAEQRF